MSATIFYQIIPSTNPAKVKHRNAIQRFFLLSTRHDISTPLSPRKQISTPSPELPMNNPTLLLLCIILIVALIRSPNTQYSHSTAPPSPTTRSSPPPTTASTSRPALRLKKVPLGKYPIGWSRIIKPHLATTTSGPAPLKGGLNPGLPGLTEGTAGPPVQAQNAPNGYIMHGG